MFSTLEVCVGSAVKRRKLYRAPQAKQVRVEGGLPFTAVRTAKYFGKVNMAAVERAAGKAAGRMLLPTGLEPAGKAERVDTSAFHKILLFNTACRLLKEALGAAPRFTLCIADRQGVLAHRLSQAVMLVSDVRVETDNFYAYSAAAARAMGEFGACVTVGDSMASADIIIDLDGKEGSSAPVVFSPCGGIGGFGVALPDKYKVLLPPSIDPADFAAALFLHSRASTLGELCYDNILLGGAQCPKSEAVRHIKCAVGLDTIDNGN